MSILVKVSICYSHIMNRQIIVHIYLTVDINLPRIIRRKYSDKFKFLAQKCTRIFTSLNSKY